MMLMELRPEVHITEVKQYKDHRICSGHFTSPLVELAPEAIPEEVHTAQYVYPASFLLNCLTLPLSFQMVLPAESEARPKLCLHMAATGDHVCSQCHGTYRSHGCIAVLLAPSQFPRPSAVEGDWHRLYNS